MACAQLLCGDFAQAWRTYLKLARGNWSSASKTVSLAAAAPSRMSVRSDSSCGCAPHVSRASGRMSAVRRDPSSDIPPGPGTWRRARCRAISLVIAAGRAWQPLSRGRCCQYRLPFRRAGATKAREQTARQPSVHRTARTNSLQSAGRLLKRLNYALIIHRCQGDRAGHLRMTRCTLFFSAKRRRGHLTPSRDEDRLLAESTRAAVRRAPPGSPGG